MYNSFYEVYHLVAKRALRREQLQAMTIFQKDLEHYYNTYSGEGRLYYERRTKQYQTDNSVVKARIITVQIQIKAFGSIFLNIPHRVTSYFGSVVKQNIESDNPTIFNAQHKYIPYYTSGLAFYRLDSLFRSRFIDSKYRRVKFFLLTVFKGLISENNLSLDHMNSEKSCNRYCEPIIAILNDSEKSLIWFKQAIEVFDISGIDLTDKQVLKLGSTTEQLLRAIREHKKR